MDDAEFLEGLLQLEAELEQRPAAGERHDYTMLTSFYLESLPRAMHCDAVQLYLLEANQWYRMLANPLHGEPITLESGSTIPACIESHQALITRQPGHQARLCMPLVSRVRRRVLGVIELLRFGEQAQFTAADLTRLEPGAENLCQALDNLLVTGALVTQPGQPSQPPPPVDVTIRSVGVVAESAVMREVFTLANTLSAVPVNVFISGENGTGKEVVSRYIHDNSTEGEQPFVAVNCAAIPESLAESEFFGYEKGAFTGAVGSRKGHFEAANGGVLFLDEIADLPLSIQPKFLRALQEQEGQRLGGQKSVPYHFRVISATNKDIRQEVAAGRFREDLFYRLFAVDIHIPPLRERREEILPLARAFLRDINQRFGKKVPGLNPEVAERFERYHWPGNVRQLRREMERLVALTPDGASIGLAACSPELRHSSPVPPALESSTLPLSGSLLTPTAAVFPLHPHLPMAQQMVLFERHLIETALQQHNHNRTHAAQQLGITRQWLLKRLRYYEQLDQTT
ncbi:sigma54 specific transcriptional regulator, Fis family [Magnetococcus marinus MC-1]|uniref:Sigma54 specific transcriptional regulator, Fis family n=1 Tax=Magnetococcus marinus (strain ATCC BAA-1437 / JCM 17883 / MC-1) TaxID=156889 RepID=A0L432_MAGMM|nr:sigma-54-dependent Fis family transcriptional regulator [Magnetococcus marinus]ABK42725.1 sigma54 specific transcriptional regulator, Fis family [Magnetococcus marinus MC-1]